MSGHICRFRSASYSIIEEVPALSLGERSTLRAIAQADVQITGLVVGWGIVIVCTGFANSYASLIVLRLLLGAFESGLFPCLALYLSSFYRRKEQARRVAYLFVASALSGAFGGLLAYGILRIDGGGRKPWQWLFISECLT